MSDTPDALPAPTVRAYELYADDVLVIELRWQVGPGTHVVNSVRIPRAVMLATHLHLLDLVLRELELKLRDGTARGERYWQSIDPVNFAAAIYPSLPTRRPAAPFAGPSVADLAAAHVEGEKSAAREAKILGRAYECVGGPFDGERRQLEPGHNALRVDRLVREPGGASWIDAVAEPTGMPQVVRGEYVVMSHARLGANLVWMGER